MEFKLINRYNFDIAIKLQNEIFPKYNARINYLESFIENKESYKQSIIKYQNNDILIDYR